MLNNIPLSEDEEDVSCDVESVFTNIPIKDTVDFICEEIYVHKKLDPNYFTNSQRNIHLVL